MDPDGFNLGRYIVLILASVGLTLFVINIKHAIGAFKHRRELEKRIKDSEERQKRHNLIIVELEDTRQKIASGQYEGAELQKLEDRKKELDGALDKLFDEFVASL